MPFKDKEKQKKYCKKYYRNYYKILENKEKNKKCQQLRYWKNKLLNLEEFFSLEEINKMSLEEIKELINAHRGVKK